jgi:hypothetical protein
MTRAAALFSIVLTSLFFSLPIQAQTQSQPEIPNGLCDPQYYNCTQIQRDLVKRFQDEGSSPELPTTDALYQGGCYMVSSTYAPETKHYGYIYLRNENGKVGFNGSFGFFYPENPYEKMTVKDARAKHAETSHNFVSKRTQDWFVDIDSSKAWAYFIRRINAEQLIMIGQWGTQQEIICELKENP